MQALRGGVDLERLRADQVLLDEVQLGLRDPPVDPRLEQLELEGDARRGVGRRGEGPHGEGLALPVDGQAGVGAVGPAALRADGLHEARGERPAEDGVGHAERDVVLVVRRGAEGADDDLRLRPLGLVHDDEAAPLDWRWRGDGIRDARARRELREEPRRERAGLLHRHVTREPEDGVRADEVLRVERTNVGFTDRLHRRKRPVRAPPVRVAGEERLAEEALRERPVVVARFEDLGGRLALEARQLVERKLGGPEETRDEIDERLDVPPDDLRVDRQRRRRQIDRHLPAEPVDRVLDRVRLHPGAPAAEHPPDDPREPLLALRIEGRPRAKCDDDRDERERVRLLDEEDRAAIELRPRGLVLRRLRRRAHWAASSVSSASPSPSSGITRTIVRAPWVR